jgi:hypothetical protein
MTVTTVDIVGDDVTMCDMTRTRTNRRDPQTLRDVEQAADELRAARHALRGAIRDAYFDGWSLRDVAAEALLSHEEVRRIVNDTPPDG